MTISPGQRIGLKHGSGGRAIVEERAVPVRDEVRAAAEMVGIDPLLVANEGKAVIAVRARSAEKVVAALRAHRRGRGVRDRDRGASRLRHPRHRVRQADPGRARGRAAPEDLLVHEYSLVEALIRRVEEEARRRSALAVRAVSVRVGDLAGVDPEMFRTAYETFRTGTVCQDAPLDVLRVPARWCCPRCRRPIARGEILRCPDCDEPARLDEGGDALTLDRIEMEVP